MNFFRRLENLKSARCENWKELRDAIGVSKTLFHYWKTGQRDPSPAQLRKVAELEKAAGIKPQEDRVLDVLAKVGGAKVPAQYQAAAVVQELREADLPVGTSQALEVDRDEWRLELSQISAELRNLLSRVEKLEARIEGNLNK